MMYGAPFMAIAFCACLSGFAMGQLTCDSSVLVAYGLVLPVKNRRCLMLFYWHEAGAPEFDDGDRLAFYVGIPFLRVLRQR